MPAGYVDRNDYCILIGKWPPVDFIYFRLNFLRLACCNWEILYAKLLSFSNLEKHTDALRIKCFLLNINIYTDEDLKTIIIILACAYGFVRNQNFFFRISAGSVVGQNDYS